MLININHLGFITSIVFLSECLSDTHYGKCAIQVNEIPVWGPLGLTVYRKRKGIIEPYAH